jgi:hypothetical protein
MLFRFAIISYPFLDHQLTPRRGTGHFRQLGELQAMRRASSFGKHLAIRVRLRTCKAAGSFPECRECKMSRDEAMGDWNLLGAVFDVSCTRRKRD